jgi:bifunctional pyridoxal-dependent enzyme with beta-cystathionase and maltose regulon repressor activities
LRPFLNRVPKNYNDDGELCPEIYNHDDLRERRLNNYIAGEANVLLTRGQECFNDEPGFFRLCYTAETLDKVLMGVDNMIQKLEALPPAAA